MTLHRPANVDDIESARAVVAPWTALAALLPLVLPLHPRGAATLEAAGLRDGDRLRIVEPLGYVAFLSLVAGARLVLTDSGGIQEETTILDVPCLTLRPEHGAADHDQPRHEPARPRRTRSPRRPTRSWPARLGPAGERPPLWDGHAGERIAETIVGWLAASRGAVTGPAPRARSDR